MARWSLGRNWRKSGLGKTVGKRLRQEIMSLGSTSGSGLYTSGRGAYRYRGPLSRQIRTGNFRGRGSYSGDGKIAHANNLFVGGNGTAPPSFSQVKDETGAVIISHREFVQDLQAPGIANSLIPSGFANQSWALNPGVEKTFPWLSQVAVNFEEYEMIQCIFLYRSIISDNGTSNNGQVGSVVAVTQYNPSAPAFVDKQSMELYAHAHSCKTTEHMKHGVECDPKKSAGAPQKYVRSAPLGFTTNGTIEDIKAYDVGTFQLAFTGTPTNFNGMQIAELWVEYTVKLCKPKLNSGRGLSISYDRYMLSINDAATATTLTTHSYLYPVGKVPGPINMSSNASAYLGYEIGNCIGTSLSVGTPINSPSCILDDGTAAVGAYQVNPILITFPSSYTGYVEVRFSLQIGSPGSGAAKVMAPFMDVGQDGVQTDWRIVWGSTFAASGMPFYGQNDGGTSTSASLGNPLDVLTATYLDPQLPNLTGVGLAGTSNIVGVYDMFDGEGAPTWCLRTGITGAYVTSANSHMEDSVVIGHFFIQPNFYGADNIVRLYTNGNSSTTWRNCVCSAMISITEYNPGACRVASDRPQYRCVSNPNQIPLIGTY